MCRESRPDSARKHEAGVALRDRANAAPQTGTDRKADLNDGEGEPAWRRSRDGPLRKNRRDRRESTQDVDGCRATLRRGVLLQESSERARAGSAEAPRETRDGRSKLRRVAWDQIVHRPFSVCPCGKGSTAQKPKRPRAAGEAMPVTMPAMVRFTPGQSRACPWLRREADAGNSFPEAAR